MKMVGKTNETREQQVFYKAGKMKMVELSTGKATILRLDKELVWEVDPKGGTYTEMTFADMERLSAQGKQEMAKAKVEMMKGMEGMSPEERQAMEKLMGGKLGAMMGEGTGTVKLSRKMTGEKQKINGYDCERMIMMANEEPLIDIWSTDAFDLGAGMFKFYEKMKLFEFEISKDLKDFRGFPVKTVFRTDTGMGTVESTTTVTKIVKGTVSDKEFELPQGLKKKNMNMLTPE
jgi:hypothetical protein